MFSAQPNYLNEFTCVNQCLLHYYFEMILMRKKETSEASHTDLNRFTPEKVMKVKAVLASVKPKNISRIEPNFCRIPSAEMLPPHQCAQGVLAWVPSGTQLHWEHPGKCWRQLQKEDGRIIFQGQCLILLGLKKKESGLLKLQIPPLSLSPVKPRFVYCFQLQHFCFFSTTELQ